MKILNVGIEWAILFQRGDANETDEVTATSEMHEPLKTWRST